MRASEHHSRSTSRSQYMSIDRVHEWQLQKMVKACAVAKQQSDTDRSLCHER
jgi:hypothetical protein